MITECRGMLHNFFKKNPELSTDWGIDTKLGLLFMEKYLKNKDNNIALILDFHFWLNSHLFLIYINIYIQYNLIAYTHTHSYIKSLLNTVGNFSWNLNQNTWSAHTWNELNQKVISHCIFHVHIQNM